MRRWPEKALLALLLGCTGAAPTDTARASRLPDLDCAALPDVTYDNWASGHLRTHCAGCHAAETPERYGAPDAVTFDTLAEVRDGAERIHARVVVEGTMPPAGGVTDEERTLLEIFLVCGL